MKTTRASKRNSVKRPAESSLDIDWTGFLDPEPAPKPAPSNGTSQAAQQPSPYSPAQPVVAPLPRLAYTLRETAAILGISYISVHRLVQRKQLKVSNALRHKLVPHTEIEDFLKRTCQ